MPDDIQRITRNTRRSQQFPPAGQCYLCGERDHHALVAGSDPVMCYECKARAEGKSGFERHHLFGRANSAFAVNLPANMHRRLSAMQEEWPEEVLRNPQGDPFMTMDATVFGILDLLKIAIDYARQWMHETFRRLSAWFTAQYGERYRERPDLQYAFALVPRG